MSPTSYSASRAAGGTATSYVDNNGGESKRKDPYCVYHSFTAKDGATRSGWNDTDGRWYCDVHGPDEKTGHQELARPGGTGSQFLVRVTLQRYADEIEAEVQTFLTQWWEGDGVVAPASLTACTESIADPKSRARWEAEYQTVLSVPKPRATTDSVWCDQLE